MSKQEYEQEKHECWLDTANFGGFSTRDNIKHSAFNAAFDRAYTLGREKESISQEEIEKAAEDYVSFEKGGKCYPSYIVERACCRAFKDGANFALGKQTETITQGQIEKAAEKFADEIRVPSTVGVMVPLLHDIAKSSYLQGAQDFIGKQEKDAEETVISGWVARDENADCPGLYTYKPLRQKKGFKDGYWSYGMQIGLSLDPSLFPDITWDSDPQEVEIIIKRKKNG